MLEFIRFLDSTVLGWMVSIRNDGLTNLFSTITFLGKWYVLIVLGLMVTYFLWRLLKKQYIFPLWFVVFATGGIVGFLKIFIQRERPLDSLHAELLPSFPSWHAAGSLAFYGFLYF